MHTQKIIRISIGILDPYKQETILQMKGTQMGHKVFVSYKYADDSVANLESETNSTARSYVNKLESLLKDQIYKGEQDDEDLSHLSEETIRKKISDRLFDSSVTIVCISPQMKEAGKPENCQWIPWEVSYSLKETTRNGIKSKANGGIALVLPDENRSYQYYLEENSCGNCCCTTHKTDKLFKVIRKNKFNKKDGSVRICSSKGKIWSGEASYFEAVKWKDFIENPNKYIDKAFDRKERIDEFDIRPSLDS